MVKKIKKWWNKLHKKTHQKIFGVLCFIVYVVFRIYGINLLTELSTPLAYLLTGLLVKYSKKIFDVKLDALLEGDIQQKAGQSILWADA